MSPKNKKELYKIRKKLDKIDNEILKLIKKRTELVKKVLKLKTFKYQIPNSQKSYCNR